ARTSAPLHAKIDELEKQTGAVGKRAMQTDEQVFVNRVRASVPEFDLIINDPEWVEYTKGKVPLTSMTLFDALQDAHNARDLERLRLAAHARYHCAQQAANPNHQCSRFIRHCRRP